MLGPFLGAMTERLAEFDLDIEPTKTALLRFGSQCLSQAVARPHGERTFSFLGFTHYVGRSRRGRFVVGRTTDAKRMDKKLKSLSDHLRRLRSEGGQRHAGILYPACARSHSVLRRQR